MMPEGFSMGNQPDKSKDNMLAYQLQDIFGANVRKYRNEKSITQVRLAEMTGIAQRNISLIERGKVNITIKQMQRIATSLNVTVQVLLSGR